MNDKQPHAKAKKQKCGAKTRSGKPCKNNCVNGKRRCRMHGGAKGSGAPFGNKNAWKHGGRSAAAIRERKRINKLLYDMQHCIKQMKVETRIED